MEGGKENLECISIIVCDEIYRDESTKKLIIVGTFNTIHAVTFPCRHNKMNVLFSVTSGRGDYDVSLTVEHGATGSPIAEIRGPMHFDNPLQIADVNVEFHGLEFPEPGKYWVTLKVEGEILRQRPILIERLRLPSANPPPPETSGHGPGAFRGNEPRDEEEESGYGEGESESEGEARSDG